MAPSLSQLNPARIRTYLIRLPLCTRLVISLIILFWLLAFPKALNIVQWGKLTPAQISLNSSRIAPLRSILNRIPFVFFFFGLSIA